MITSRRARATADSATDAVWRGKTRQTHAVTAERPGIRLRQLGTDQLTPADIGALRDLLWAAFAEDEHGGFGEDDWRHALGGIHFVLEVDAQIASHAAVVERELHVAGRALRTGYVEAVATVPALQGQGLGTLVMREVNDYVAAKFELGALATGSQAFYERLGWRTWRGRSYVRTEHGEQRTSDEDGYILVLLTPSSPPLDLESPISCDWRSGDVW